MIIEGRPKTRTVMIINLHKKNKQNMASLPPWKETHIHSIHI